MIGVLVAGSIAVAAYLIFEALRWAFRPEARRLRTIRKIGGRR